jgi:hypothetical protein
LAVALVASVCAAQAQNVEVVQPNSHYFADWVFLKFTNPPGSTVNMLPGDSNSSTSLVGRTLTITDETPSATPGDTFLLHPLYSVSHGNPANLPANIDFGMAANEAMLDINRGQASFTFAQPLPKGTVFFINDVDINEIGEYRFVDCGGNLVDADNFIFLQISNTSATNPPAYSIEGTAPSRYWRLAALSSADDPNSINGIVIESDQVCGVQISGTRPSDGGGVGYFFGMPPSPLTVAKSVASVNGSASQTRLTEPQDTVDYAITLNNSTSDAITVYAGFLQENLPAGVTFASSADFTCTGLSCANTSDVVVPAGGSVTLHITVKVDSSLSRQATPTLTNTVALTALNLNCAAAGNQCSVTTRTSPQTTAAPIPTLTDMALLLLAALLGLSAVAVHRRGR